MGIFVNRQITSIFLSILCLYYMSIISTCNGEGRELIANFVFGDSLVDAGNNNYIAVSISKANYPPNGIDLGVPTGRFTNGRTTADIIGQQFGLETFSPPYLAPTTKGTAIMQGVNYASGASGILNATGYTFIGRLNFDAQLDNFANTKQDLISTIGEEATNKFIEKALFLVTMGSNDFLSNYLVPFVSIVEQTLVSPQAFVNQMISKYRLQLTRLRKMGAKKIVVVNVGPIGCIPYTRDINPLAGSNCVAFPNYLAQLFNFQLKLLITELSNNLQGSQFVYADAYRVVSDLLLNYTSYGFENANSACCYVSGRYGGLIPCGRTSRTCKDRSKYVFWDPYHPSDAANVLIANRFIDGDSSVISPINIRQLIHS
ncbi:GDSL esterase/lipase At4g16230-like [Silene latifolia]|uniref:GDSL esterase/lipase At4g16230-like n=1 Tax=Silene latifolia TaxID=37657 RepID=UPI003D77226D